MASATASKAIGGQIQNLHTNMNSHDLIPVLLHYDSEINGLRRVVLVQKTFSSLIFAIFQKYFQEYLDQISETKPYLLSILPLMRAKY